MLIVAAAAKSNTTRVIKKAEFDATSHECQYALHYQPVVLDKEDAIEFDCKRTLSKFLNFKNQGKK